MRVLVCGDRNWKAKHIIMQVLQQVKPKIVIEGGANGADTLARECAKELHIDVEEYVAEWQMYGTAAGPIRNRKMLMNGKPELVLAFHDNIDSSKGTRNMIKIALNAKIKVELYKSSGERVILVKGA